jgi:hypothetical protein
LYDRRLQRAAGSCQSLNQAAAVVWHGGTFQSGLAKIEARAGSPEEAIKRPRHFLSIPAGAAASIALLKIDPVWDPIRNDPGFQKLLSEPEPERQRSIGV